MADRSETTTQIGNPFTNIVRKYRENRRVIDTIVSIAIGLALWELAGRLTPPIVFVGVLETAQAFVDLVESGVYFDHLLISAKEFAFGYTAAVTTGLAIGLVMAMSDTVRTYINPWIDALYATPRLAIAPLIIVWLGIGIESKIVIIWLTAVFPMIINTVTGFDNVGVELQTVAKSFGASNREIFTTVLFPGALPYIVSGVRLASSRSIVGMVVAEFLGARAGIGYLIFQSSGAFRIDDMLVGIVTVAVVGILIVQVLYRVQAYLAPWLEHTEEE